MLYKRVAFDDYNQALEFLEKLKNQTELDPLQMYRYFIMN